MDGITNLMDIKFEQTPEDSEGQGSLVCCSPWGHKESDTTEQQRTTTEVGRRGSIRGVGKRVQNMPQSYLLPCQGLPTPLTESWSPTTEDKAK